MYTSKETYSRTEIQLNYGVESNHLGNVLVTVSARPRLIYDNQTFKYKEADVTSVSDYYPFGMLAPGRHWQSDGYRFGFNGQEKTDEIAGEGNHNTALFWEYDTRTGRRWNLDPKPQINISDYACFGGNPIFFIDLIGDSFDPTNIKEKNDKGEYKYPLALKSFELFASSKFGKKYILNRAEKGFKYEGAFVNFTIEAKEDGKLHKQGIDVSFGVSSLSSSYSEGETDHSIVNGRLKINVNFSDVTAIDWATPVRLLRGTNNWAHEALYHGDEYEKKYLSGGTSNRSDSKQPFWSNNNYNHTLNWEKTLHGTYGIGILVHARDIIWNQRSNSSLFFTKTDNPNFQKQLLNNLSSKPSNQDLLDYLFYGLPNDKYRINTTIVR